MYLEKVCPRQSDVMVILGIKREPDASGSGWVVGMDDPVGRGKAEGSEWPVDRDREGLVDWSSRAVPSLSRDPRIGAVVGQGRPEGIGARSGFIRGGAAGVDHALAGEKPDRSLNHGIAPNIREVHGDVGFISQEARTARQDAFVC